MKPRVYLRSSSADATWQSLMLRSWRRIVVAAVIALVSLSAAAQESKKEWRISDPSGQTELYSTQQKAVEGIKTLPAPSGYPPEFQGGWQYVEKVKSFIVSEDGHLSITYWMGKDQPSDPDWSYYASGGPFSSEEAMVTSYVESIDDNPACPGATAVPQGNWFAASPTQEGTQEFRRYTATFMFGSNTPDSPCWPNPKAVQFLRMRRLHCPNPYAMWSNDYEACVNEKFVATITSKTDECDKNGGGGSCKDKSLAEDNQGECDGNVGNPCNVKTGEKYEIEPDFDLGWIALTRYYHSGVSTGSGGFGHGWTHSFSTRLAIGGPDAVGLIEGTGYQRPFKKIGSSFEATDGSGDRLIHGSDWTLYTAGSITAFDTAGRLHTRLLPDGTWLSYAYDDRERLSTITHSSGRNLVFDYLSDDHEALIGSVLSNGAVLATYTYTSDGQVETVTYPGAGVRAYHYEDSRFPRHLTGVTAEDGQRYSTFAYDDLGRVISSQHTGGADGVTLTYGSGGGAVVTDALGHQTTYGLTSGGATDPSRKVTSLVDARGAITRTYYDQSVDFRRRLDTFTDRDGTQTKHTYAEITDPVSGLLASVHTMTEAVGLPEERIIVERRDLVSNRLLSAAAGEREVRYAYNARLQPSTMTIKDLGTGQIRVTTFTYCDAADVAVPGSTCPIEGLPKAVDGPRTDVVDITTYAYYSSDDASCVTAPAACPYRKGDLWKTTNALGQVTEILAYDSAGRPRSVKDTNGVITDYEYHSRGWLMAQKVRGEDNASETDDHIIRIDYWPTGLVRQITEPDGAFTIYTYDAAQRLTDVADNVGNVLHYTLDAAGNRWQEDISDPSGTLRRTLSRVYNQLGQLETLADAQSNPTDFSYDLDGNPDTVTDALGRVTDHDYDPLNRLKRTLQDAGGIAAQTQVSYDALDNPVLVTDPKGLQTTYSYNAFGDLLQQVSPDSGVSNYTYDGAGNRKTRTDPRGITAIYGYDALNRLVSIAYPDASLNVTYIYDIAQPMCDAGEPFAAGRLSRMSDANGSTQYCYDRFGQLVRKVQTTNGKVFTLRYAYTAAGRLSAVTYPDGAVVDYGRNTLGQVNEVGITPGGGTRQILLNQATYYPFGPVAGWVYGNGRSLQRNYDQDYRPQSILDGASGGLDLGFGFDAAGNLHALNTALSAAPLLRFDYDALSRLTQTQDGPTGTPLETYAYDATGDRIAFTNSAGVQNYGYQATSHRLNNVSGIARSYDAAGNTTSVGGTARTFVYSDTGRMRQVKVGGMVVATYGYNGKGERVRKTTDSADIYTLYDESGHWVGDYDSAGAPLQQAIWLDDLPVGLLAGPGQQLHYIEPDHLGAPRVVIDAIRDVAEWEWHAKSEVFGNSPPHQDPDADGTVFVLDLRFPGQRYDSATGLNYNYFRDYDPRTGRYAQSDPIGLSGGMATYAYVGGNPISFVDPLGLEWRYNSLTGILYHNGTYVAKGYAGHGAGVNSPWMQGVPNVGPLPTGRYTIGPQYNSPNTGRATMALTPAPTNEMYGRSAFRIHGDNSRRNRTASEGCMIFDRGIRDQIVNSGDNDLVVESRLPVIIPFW